MWYRREIDVSGAQINIRSSHNMNDRFKQCVKRIRQGQARTYNLQSLTNVINK